MTLFILLVVAILIYYFFIYRDNHTNATSKNKLKKCSNCGSSIEDNFNICPICKETLKRKCSNCLESVDSLWNFCPYCERPLSKGGKK